MTILILPCGPASENQTDITYRVPLEGKEYDIRYKYLQRESNIASGKPVIADEWYVYLGLTGKPPFIKTALRTNREFLEMYRYHPDCPAGNIVLRDSIADSSVVSGGNYNPERVTYDELGQDKRFKVLYFSADQ